MQRSRRLAFLLAAAITLVAVAALLPGLDNGFAWDDDANIVNNHHFRGLSAAHLRWMLTTTHMGHYQPLSWLSLAVDHALWGLDPMGYHLTSLLIHLLNALLLFALASRLIGARSARLAADPAPGTAALQVGAAVAAMLFAVHPLRVESVVWVTERRDVLAASFYLLGLLAYVRAAQLHRRWLWLTVSLVAFGASLLSKAWVITLPAVLLVLDIYPLRRIPARAANAGAPDSPEPPGLSSVLMEKIPFALLGVAAGLMALFAQDSGGALTSASNLSWADRLMQANYGLCFYLLKSIWPTDLSPLYLLRASELRDTAHLAALVCVVGISTVVLLRARRWPWMLAAWLCYVLMVSPVLGFAQSGLQATADRYTYLSMWPWSIIAGAATTRLLSAHFTSTSVKRAVWVTVALSIAVLVALLCLTTRDQTTYWRDSERLFTQAIALDHRNYAAYNSRGARRHARGRLVAARQDFDRAIEIAPRFAASYANRGLVLLEQGDLSAADRDLQAAAQLDPRQGAAWCGQGMVHHRMGRPARALAAYDRGLHLRPSDASCYTNRGLLHHQQKRFAAALHDQDTAVNLDPDLTAAYINRAGLRRHRSDLAGAIADYTRALVLAPDDARAYSARGSAREEHGDWAGALEDYTRSLRIKPQRPWPLLRRGLLYKRLKRHSEASKDFSAALRYASPTWRHRPRVEALLTQARQPAQADR